MRRIDGQSVFVATRTPAMYALLEDLRVAARHDVVTLLSGETGSGKTHVARLIHELSLRGKERFCTVACGALPAELIESELFGYAKGAFTGADRDKEGKFAAAGRGTLLLDEIDVLPLEQQTRLLRVIETGEYEPVGSNVTQHSQARLIVASNCDLDTLSHAGSFRRDLFFRLNVLRLELPPLRQRLADLPLLAQHFAAEHSAEHGIPLVGMAPEFLQALACYPWPGNVRELENVIRRAVLYCRDGVLRAGDLPSAICPGNAAAVTPNVPSPPNHGTGRLETLLEEFEQQVIAQTLRRHRGRRGVTAQELGISRVTLYHKMKKFGMLAG